MTAPTASAPPTSSAIRPALGLLAGLGVTALVVGPGIVAATLAMLRGVDANTFRPSTANLVVYLAITGAGAFAGGFTTARITAGRSFYTIFLLALILFVSAMVPVLRGADPAAPRPQWFLVAQAVVVLVAALLAGWLERRRQAAP